MFLNSLDLILVSFETKPTVQDEMSLQFRMDPGQMLQETYTVEEDPQESPPVVSVEISEDGTTRRTETTVT